MARSESQVVYVKTLVFISAIIIAFSAWLWWAVIYNNKQNIFDSMISNSLSTKGVTRIVAQEDASGILTQLAQAQFGADNLVQVKTTITQQQDEGETKVVTETIGTPEENFARYITIDVPGEKQPDFSDVIDVWGVQLGSEGGNSVFSEAVYGVVLFGNLAPENQAELMSMIEEKDVYTPDYDSVESVDVDGKSAFAYTVTVNTKSYIEVLKRYDEMLGLKLAESLNPEDYAQAPAINVKVFVDKRSRQLLKIEHTDNNRDEIYRGYGITKNVNLPEDPISRSELEQQLQGLFQ